VRENAPDMSERSDDQGSSVGSYLALVVGLGMLGGAAYVGLSGGETVLATIMVLIGASALSGWVRARRKK